METKLSRFFIFTAGVILLAAAAVRFLVVAGNAPFMSAPDPMLAIPLRYAVLIVGGFELTAALICLFGRQVGLQTVWLVWLATNFFVYQIGLFWMHCHSQYTCLGSLTDPLHFSHGATRVIMGFIPIYLLVGSCASTLWFWFSKEGEAVRLAPMKRSEDRSSLSAPLETLKMICALCNGHIEFSAINLEQKIPCPHCKTTITLRKPDFLKMTCFFCKEHIEFPTHAIGQKIACPHCKMDITLKQPA